MKNRLLIYFRVLTLRNTTHPLGLLGLLAFYISILLMVIFLSLETLGFHQSPYMGIVTFMALPTCMVAGLGLVFLGRVLGRRRGGPGGSQPLYAFPNWDLNDHTHRRKFAVMLVTVIGLLTLTAMVSYRGVEFMESETFCGKTCHTVMQPEHLAYSNSPHSNVRCVDCHIGPGAGWFVKSKISGLRQVFAVMGNTFSRPIETPIHNLRPARETCEQCHWPEKFHGDRLMLKRHFQEDEENTELVNLLLLKVGGGSTESGFAEGIHWHMSPDTKVEYIADEKREEIYWVRSAGADGEVTEFVMDGFDADETFFAEHEIRQMDCMDCHNRPTHTFEEPGYAVDKAIAGNAISVEIPYIKREVMRAIQVDYATREEAELGIASSLETFYADGDWSGSEELAFAVAKAREIYMRNIFPEMGIAWGTYPNHIGHEDFPGCFRCHDDEHSSSEGETISQDCDTCHSILAWEEHEPAIMEELFP